MGGKNKAPPPPDYRGAAQEQSAADRWQTQYQTAANRPNLNTPWGSSQWTNEAGPDGMPNWSQNISLSPSEQAKFDSQQRIQQGRTDIAEGMMGGGYASRPQLDESGEPVIGEDGEPVMQERGGMGGEMMTPPGFWENLSPAGNIPQTGGLGGYMPQQRPMEQLPGPGGMPQGSRMGRLPGMADYSQFAGMVGGGGDQSNEGLLPGYGDMTDFQQTGPSDIQMGVGGAEYDPRFAEANYEREMSMLGPSQQAAMAAQESQLRNQGLRPGTQAYDSALQNLRTQQGEEQSRLRQSSVLRGAEEQQRQFGRDLSSGQFANQAAGQEFGQGMSMADQAQSLRGQQFGELNQLAQLRGGGQEAAFQRAMQLSGAQNQLRGQEFGQQMQYGDQQYGQQMGQAQLQDARRGQEFGQQMAYGQRDFNEQMQQAQLAQSMQGQDFGQQMQQSNYQNQLRQQQVAEQMQREGWSLNKINALLSGQQVGMPQMPSFSEAGKAQGPQYLSAAGAQGDYGMAAHQADVSQSNAFWNALGGIGGGLAGGMF